MSKTYNPKLHNKRRKSTWPRSFAQKPPDKIVQKIFEKYLHRKNHSGKNAQKTSYNDLEMPGVFVVQFLCIFCAFSIGSIIREKNFRAFFGAWAFLEQCCRCCAFSLLGHVPEVSRIDSGDSGNPPGLDFNRFLVFCGTCGRHRSVVYGSRQGVAGIYFNRPPGRREFITEIINYFSASLPGQQEIITVKSIIMFRRPPRPATNHYKCV